MDSRLIWFTAPWLLLAACSDRETPEESAATPVAAPQAERPTAGAPTGAPAGQDGTVPAPREAEPAAGAEATPDTAAAVAPVFCGVRTREYELWLHYGTEDPLYTVKSRDGRVLASEIDDARLRRDYEELHELLHGAVDLIGVGGD